MERSEWSECYLSGLRVEEEAEVGEARVSLHVSVSLCIALCILLGVSLRAPLRATRL